MRGTTHLSFALLTASIADIAIQKHITPYPIIIAGISALLPDIDQPNSKLGRKIKPISFLINLIFGHRTITHSLDFAIALSIITLSLAKFSFLSWFFVLGYFSHLLLDSLTDSGIRLTIFSQRRIGLKLCNTGGIIDIGLGIISIMIFLSLIYKNI